ncbi:Dihydrolipoyllysine-residue succinyltransferase component of 2-oxoglutarate dehydrogenase complex [Piscirickettsia salmonis]|uniref:Dihydrolipoyllysine-residue succinyltransferase n=1 Tax=Piscirickettsia salmonis TaxID=1238 RepID=A0A1L6TGP3_PISSA|nr:dihydrolipoyllysine-residue succinyltransferase [Piscirickettsia salmonis]AKP72965.1 dihydrolipoamide succinyltransferase [Piscirickettsia salmonis LF-89 = ATCC VR-1361]ALB21592.1 dihydrolipoyllysine-residue succinyltransferase, E2 component of oxoglutarate dehydrogenase [Piscirickettsia salmonis]ALY01799.1 dihydrolipoamide succinyltransferase [Piscirickettsia salmonis]AMA41310.1 dihydrolipoamide succinyltransferase [Piscirickettsia salmonis]AOS36509.1 dihydrolipoamide succinyltransferase [
MSSVEIKTPVFPESVTDGTIVAWHKQPGEAVEQEETIVEIETDKVVLEVPAPADGVLEAIAANEGDTVVAEQLLGTIKEGAVAKEQSAVAAPATESQPQPAAQVAPAAKSTALAAKAPEVEGHLSPSLRRKVGEGVDVSSILGVAPEAAGRLEKRVPMSRLRARVAERLLEAQHNNALLTTFNEVNMKPVMDLRKQYKDKFEKDHDARLGFMSFFLKACVVALKEFPEVNASVDGTDILYHNYYDIGVAISSPRGLVVPVLRNVDQLSFAGVESGIIDYAYQARDGKLAMEDMMGGTFTVTNGGTFGSMMSTPIINPPQSAILGMHNIVERAVVEKGEIVIRPMMYIALSYDHRIIDGASSVRFLVRVKEMLEDPARMLLNV